MAESVAKRGDLVVGLDLHVVLVPASGGPVPTIVSLPFAGPLSESLCERVQVCGEDAATAGSVAMNEPRHIPVAGPFQRPPANRATMQSGSMRVLVANKPLVRNNDAAITCNDPIDKIAGHAVAAGRVLCG